MAKNAIKRAEAIDKLRIIDVPYNVWRLIGAANKIITVGGSDQICLGEDYASISEIRECLEWYAKQFDGTIQWENE